MYSYSQIKPYNTDSVYILCVFFTLETNCKLKSHIRELSVINIHEYVTVSVQIFLFTLRYSIVNVMSVPRAICSWHTADGHSKAFTKCRFPNRFLNSLNAFIFIISGAAMWFWLIKNVWKSIELIAIKCCADIRVPAGWILITMITRLYLRHHHQHRIFIYSVLELPAKPMTFKSAWAVLKCCIHTK